MYLVPNSLCHFDRLATSDGFLSALEFLGEGEGVEDRYHNKGLVDGYKYFQSLPPEKQQKLRDAAKANGWDLEKDRVTELERGVRPMVEDMFKRMEEEREKAAQKKIMKLMGWAG